MKKLLAVLTLASASLAVSAADSVIYVVDISQVMQSYYKTKQAQEQIASAVEVTNNELKAMNENYAKLAEELKGIETKLKNPALTEDSKKEIAEKEYQPKFKELQTVATNLRGVKTQTEQKLASQSREIMAVHKKEIIKVIEKVAADKKADFVIEKNAVYFSKPACDITEDVIAAANASAPKN